MKQVRYGIVGIGNMGTSHANWLAEGLIEGARLSAVCDIDGKRRKWAHENLPREVQIFNEYGEMLDSEILDAVIIAVPHYLHPDMAIMALDRDLHTLVEKPAGVYASQILEMNLAAEKKSDLKFGMMFNQRMNPLYQKVKEILDQGIIGELRRVSWLITSWWRTQKYYDSSPWRATWWGEGGGVLVNQAPHQLDLLQWMCGMPTHMRAFLKYGSHREIAVEDDVTAYFEYDNGASGTFITCTHDALGTDRLEIHGDNGKIIIEDSRRVTVKQMFKPEEELNRELDFRQMLKLVKGETSEKLYREEVFEYPENWDQQHIDVLINFTNAILFDVPLVAPGCEGIKAVELANAMYLSDWLDSKVNVPVNGELFHQELSRKVDQENRGR